MRMRRFYIVRRLIARLVFMMDDNPYDLTLAKDRRWILRRFKDILTRSKNYVYVSQTKARPILYEPEFRDSLIKRATSRLESPVDIRILVHRDHSEEFGYWDSSFRVTQSRIGDFIIGDAGALLMESRDGVLVKIRDLRLDDSHKKAFLLEYERGYAEQTPPGVPAWNSLGGSKTRRQNYRLPRTR
jgi:hypothetical protein